MDFQQFIEELSRLLDEQRRLDRIEAALHQITTQLETIMVTEKEALDALTKIDAATTQIGVNVSALGKVAGTIDTEMDALIAAVKAAGVSQAIIDQAVAIGVKADALNTASSALVPVLDAIAAKGVANPVPIPVPPPIVVPPAI